MRVRDKTVPVSEYKGQWTDTSDAECPCRPCYNPHDCGYYRNGPNNTRVWVKNVVCATRYNSGCPSPKPEPRHIYQSKRGREKYCVRCGCWREKEEQQ